MSGGPKTFCGAKELADQKKATKVKNYVTLQFFALFRLGIKTDFRDLRGTPSRHLPFVDEILCVMRFADFVNQIHKVVFDGFPFASQLFTCIFSTKSHLPSGMFPRHSFPLNYDKMYAWLG